MEVPAQLMRLFQFTTVESCLIATTCLALSGGPGCFKEPLNTSNTSATSVTATGSGSTSAGPTSVTATGSTATGITESGSAGFSGSRTTGDSSGTSGSTSTGRATDSGGCPVLTLGENVGDDITGVTTDTWFDEEFPTQINADDDDLRADGVSANGLDENLVLRFELGGLPPGEIVGAVLHLSTNDDDGAESSPGSQFTLHRVNEPWVEGEATWVEASATVEWSVPGCIAAPCIGQELTFFEPLEKNHPYELPLDVAMVQSWRDDPDGNTGVLISTEAANGASFHSSESPDNTMRPSLHVELCR